MRSFSFFLTVSARFCRVRKSEKNPRQESFETARFLPCFFRTDFLAPNHTTPAVIFDFFAFFDGSGPISPCTKVTEKSSSGEFWACPLFTV